MKTCGECGSFCSCGALWPAGLCLPSGYRLIDAAGTACVCWEKDWRGVDQSDGIEQQTASASSHAKTPPPPQMSVPAERDIKTVPAGSHFRQSLLF